MDVYEMSDAELEAAFREAKAGMDSPDTVYEEIYEEEEEEEEVADLEQPNEDSDYETSDEMEVEDESEEVSEADDGHDGEPDEVEEEADEGEEDTEIDAQPVQKHKFKANGKEYEFTMEEIVSQFPKVFGQAMDYTKKTQAIGKYRRTIDAIESAKLGHEDVNLAIDVLKGDKNAIAEVLKRNNIDTLDLDTDGSKYVAKDYGRDEKTIAIHDVIEEINDDPEYVTTSRVLSKEWDDASFQEFVKDPELIRALHIDVKNGDFSKVQPIAEKMKVYDRGRKSDLDYYKDAAKVYYGEIEAEKARQAEVDRIRADRDNRVAEKARISQVRADEAKAKAVKEESAKRKAAAPTKKVAGTKKSINYLDDSEEAYWEWYNNMPRP